MAESQGFQPNLTEIENYLLRAKEALELGQLEMEEGYYWGTISRSYYAAFYIVKAVLLSHGEITKSHGGTINRFSELFIKTGKIDQELGTWYGKAMEARNNADYDVREDWTLQEASNALVKAKEFVQAVEPYVKM